MRVIAGKLGGRVFDSPGGHRTHPMSDRIRGALFNALGDISGLNVLDVFAGSGALSFEAVSRDAGSALAIEADKSAQQAIADNIDRLQVAGSVKLVKAKAQSWLGTTDEKFDVVLCDPPYDHVNDNLLIRLAERVKPGGIIVFSMPPKAPMALSKDYTLLQRKDYGDATLTFYRRSQEG